MWSPRRCPNAQGAIGLWKQGLVDEDTRDQLQHAAKLCLVRLLRMHRTYLVAHHAPLATLMAWVRTRDHRPLFRWLTCLLLTATVCHQLARPSMPSSSRVAAMDLVYEFFAYGTFTASHSQCRSPSPVLHFTHAQRRSRCVPRRRGSGPQASRRVCTLLSRRRDRSPADVTVLCAYRAQLTPVSIQCESATVSVAVAAVYVDPTAVVTVLRGSVVLGMPDGASGGWCQEGGVCRRSRVCQRR